MKTFALIFVMFSLFVVKSNAQDSDGTNKEEKKVLRLVNNLPEVKNENSRRAKLGIKRLLKAFIQNTPTKEGNYYMVSITEDLGDQLRTYEWFHVDAKTFVIKYYDMIELKSISLAQWRKHKNHKN